jgi:hypothetical protein
MELDIITFKTAKLAEEVGFNISQDYCYDVNGILFDNKMDYDGYKFGQSKAYTVAPIQEGLQKWLRNVHKIEVLIEATASQLSSDYGYNFYIWNKNTRYEYWSEPKNTILGESSHDTYEEALEAGLQHALTLIR